MRTHSTSQRRVSTSAGLRSADDGSIMPLAVGFTTIAIALILLAAVITDVSLAHRRLYALTDAAARAAADSFEPTVDGEPGIAFDDEAVDARARQHVRTVGPPDGFGDIDVIGRTPDGVSVEVTITGRFSPALLSPFAPRGVELSSHATVRGALRR